MTPEKQTKDPKAAQKQKIMIGVIVVILLVVVWQFIDLGGSSSSTPAVTPTSVATAAKPTSGASALTPASQNPVTSGAAAAPPTVSVEMKQERIPVNSEMSKLQQQSQSEYIASLDKLQMLKLQREIDETKMAIATAELNRMTAEKSIADLITSKQDTAPVDNTPPPIQNSAPIAPVTVVSPPPAPVVEVPYTVLSVSYEGRKWAAVVSAGPGKMYTVNVGDVLPADASTVIAIDKQGITTKRNNITRIIPLTSMSM